MNDLAADRRDHAVRGSHERSFVEPCIPRRLTSIPRLRRLNAMAFADAGVHAAQRLPSNCHTRPWPASEAAFGNAQLAHQRFYDRSLPLSRWEDPRPARGTTARRLTSRTSCHSSTVHLTVLASLRRRVHEDVNPAEPSSGAHELVALLGVRHVGSDRGAHAARALDLTATLLEELDARGHTMSSPCSAITSAGPRQARPPAGTTATDLRARTFPVHDSLRSDSIAR